LEIPARCRKPSKGKYKVLGIESGDIILQINRKTVAEPDEFGEVLSTAPPGTNIVLTVVDHRSLNASIVQVSAP
jgi:S1-C subfamily serine protease